MRRIILDPIPPKLKQLWDTCDLRSFIILSLSLQAFMIFVAPLRKRIKNNLMLVSLWCAYLSADWAANFAVGLILNSQGDIAESSRGRDRSPMEHEDLLAFWAAFLLVHLGGPDTITAFALEDNELWRRHLLGLVLQCVAIVYVFILSLPNNRLWIPTVMIFLTGMIKYIERSRSLYLASVDKFKYSMLEADVGIEMDGIQGLNERNTGFQEIFSSIDPSTNYATLLNLYFSMRTAKLPTELRIYGMAKSTIKSNTRNLTELQVVQFAYQFYQKYIGLYVDIVFDLKEWNESRNFFFDRTPKDAFRVVEAELNFMYDALFTKLPVVYSRFGIISRFFSLVMVCLATILFTFKSKTNFRSTDVMITYALLFGALILDTSSLFILSFSNWAIIALITPGQNQIWKQLLKHQAKTKSPTFKRWCMSIPSYNLIYYCLHPRPKLWEKVVDTLGVKDYLDSVVYVKSKPFSTSLRDFIFDELKSKSEYVDDMSMAKEISLARGAWVLESEGCENLLKYILDVTYDQSIILWHLATEICYNSDLQDGKRMFDDEHMENMKMSKVLSDYMMYLLSMQPSMMFAVASVGQKRVLDTCVEICKQVKRICDNEKYLVSFSLFQRRMIETRNNMEFDFKHINVCNGIRKASDELNSLLFQSCRLVNEFMKMEDRWVVISKVWVEMLCYAASHSRASMQVAQVSKGGELITIVWLLMTHFGLGDRFQHNKRKTTAQLFVGK